MPYLRDKDGNVLNAPVIPEHERKVEAAKLSADDSAIAAAVEDYRKAQDEKVAEDEKREKDDARKARAEARRQEKEDSQ